MADRQGWVVSAISEKLKHQDGLAELQLTDLLTAADFALQSELARQLHLLETEDPGFDPATLAITVTALRRDEANVDLSEVVDIANRLNAIEESLSDLKWSSSDSR